MNSRFPTFVGLLGLTGILFVSLVPPMRIPASEMNCRFHFMAERALPFTKAYSVKYPDVQAMLSEYGIILAVCGLVIGIAHLFKNSAHSQPAETGFDAIAT
ncbi:MAG: hypothetical protein KDC95_05520 [Planctomycetes bacterium]|nr:hypothetical protein [Planctomycetota bacterium]